MPSASRDGQARPLSPAPVIKVMTALLEFSLSRGINANAGMSSRIEVCQLYGLSLGLNRTVFL